MLTMMIVDDEPLAVHYLTETLLELEDMDFEMLKAHSGKEADREDGSWESGHSAHGYSDAGDEWDGACRLYP